MTAPPIPTFVPRDLWYSLTTGNINPSEADSVPNIAYLQPSSTPQGDVDGLVGSLDGALIYLAGIATELDGGQKWLMWKSTSLAIDNGSTIFCPFADATEPGRWTDASIAADVATMNATYGVNTAIPTLLAHLIRVFIINGVTGTTTVTLPTTTILGQTVWVKDTVGNASTQNITVAGTIDGATNDVLSTNYEARSYVWNGVDWSMT